MKRFKHLRKALAILLGVFGLSTLLSSCFKEKDCKCTYSYDGYTQEMIVTTKSKCEDLKFSYDGQSIKMDCEK
ncbi:MAG: hypothetical protein JXB49_36785 [Bacteroidales bacterium]|nr:hypothetical protein [Bacteroidales bacterium]